MSIVFGCTCGKRLQAPDEFAGRRMKCKTCGTVLAIPKAGAAKAAKPMPMKPAAKPPAPPLAEPNPWADRSLEQRIAFWRDGDENRPGAREKVARASGLLSLVLMLAVVACLAGAGWFLLRPS